MRTDIISTVNQEEMKQETKIFFTFLNIIATRRTGFPKQRRVSHTTLLCQVLLDFLQYTHQKFEKSRQIIC